MESGIQGVESRIQQCLGLKRGKGIATHTKKKKNLEKTFLHLNPFPDINNHYHKLLISCRGNK